MLDQEQIFSFLTTYAYSPLIIYSFIILVLTASSFGLPIPEEIVLISCGIIGFLSLNPEKFPPPYPGATPVDPISLAIVCFLAVFLSDFLVFWIGRKGGMKLRQSPRLNKYVTSNAFNKVEKLTEQYGALMSGVFRFTPGLRFPGHLACGMMGLSPWKFCLVDGSAALLTVPTQVLLVAYYGENILQYFKQFKIIVLIILVLFVMTYFLRKLFLKKVTP